MKLSRLVPFVAIALAPLSAAQGVPAEPVDAPLQLASERVLVDRDSDGALWARGSTYKASFDGRAMTYVPFLGSSAPRDYPVSFALESATVASRAVELGARVPARIDGDTVIQDRGAVRETYALALDSIEQSFTFDALPERGELVVRLAVDTELAARADGAGFSFANELGAVRYGAATAVDATGRSLPLESRLEDGAIEIRVPASFVEHATLPLTVDPVLSTFTLVADSQQRFRPSATFTGRWFVVHELVFSASDHDVVLQVWNNVSPPTPFATIAIDNTTLDHRNPRIASDDATGTVLVVSQAWQGAWTIFGRTVSHDTTAIGPSVQISAGAASSCVEPDVGGGVAPSSDAFMVVWTQQTTSPFVQGRVVNHSGGFVTPIFQIGLTFSASSGHPAISNMAKTDWTVAWETTVMFDEPDIWAARYATNGTLLGSFHVDDGPLETRAPSVSPELAGTNRYVVTYERVDGGGNSNIIAALFDDMTKIAELDVSAAEGATTALRSQRRPDVDCNGKRFTLVYSEIAPPSTTNTNVSLDEIFVSAGSLELAESRVQLSSSSTPDDHAQIMAKRSGTGANIDVRNFVVWDDNGLAIEGAIYENTLGGRVTRVCPGDLTNAICPCGNIGGAGNGCANSVHPEGGSLSSSGDASLAFDSLVLDGQSMPGGSSCLYFQGTTLAGSGFGVVFGDGLRCASGSVLRLATKANSAAGASSYPESGDAPIPIDGAIPSGGATRFYQVWYRNSAAFCTASTFNLTNALEVVWSS